MSAHNASSFISSGIACALICATAVASGFSRTSQVDPLGEARRLFAEFQYEVTIKVLDKAIASLVRASDSPPEMLAEAYALRARSYYALGDRVNAEQDFTLLIGVSPEYSLGDEVSPPVVALFNDIRARTVGRLLLTIVPATDVIIIIDGRRYAAAAGQQTLYLAAGEHTVSVSRPGHRPMSERVTVQAGETAELALTLERMASTVSIVTVPAGVEVLMDGVSRGTTQAAEGSDSSAPLVVDEVSTGKHRLEFRRDCYSRGERALAIERADDYAIGPIRLVPATARVTLALDEAEAEAETAPVVYVDGRKQNVAAGQPIEICEGERTLEVRSPRGRFSTRPLWRGGDTPTVTVILRPAFVILEAAPGEPRARRDRLALVEEMLSGASALLFFSPGGPGEQPVAPAPRVAQLRLPPEGAPAERWREAGRRIADEFEAQGVVWFAADPSDRETLQLWLLAAGSGAPDRMRVRRGDRDSVAELMTLLQREPPPLLRRSIEASLVDVGATPAPGVVRVVQGGVADTAGLRPGDVIVRAGGAAVSSETELEARLTAGVGGPVALEVRGPDGRARSVSVTPIDIPRIVALAARGVVYNKLLLELGDLARRSAGSAKAAAELNVAAVQLRLASPDEARLTLEQIQAPAGSSWSATAAYLRGLAYEALGRPADARAAFERASSAHATTLGDGGPTIAILAQRRLKAGAK